MSKHHYPSAWVSKRKKILVSVDEESYQLLMAFCRMSATGITVSSLIRWALNILAEWAKAKIELGSSAIEYPDLDSMHKLLLDNLGEQNERSK